MTTCAVTHVLPYLLYYAPRVFFVQANSLPFVTVIGPISEKAWLACAVSNLKKVASVFLYVEPQLARAKLVARLTNPEVMLITEPSAAVIDLSGLPIHSLKASSSKASPMSVLPVPEPPPVSQPIKKNPEMLCLP